MSNKPLKHLSDEQVDGVAGGYLYLAGHGTGNSHWEVLDDEGNTVEKFDDYYTAFYCATDNGYTTNVLNTKELETLRATGWPWRSS